MENLGCEALSLLHCVAEKQVDAEEDRTWSV